MKYYAPYPLTRGTEGSAGYDLRWTGKMWRDKHDRLILGTGLHIAIPPGHVGLLTHRSSGGAVHLGVIDSDYRGEVGVHLPSAEVLDGTEVWSEDEDDYLTADERFAQLVIVKLCDAMAEQVDSIEALGGTTRGAGGFGSTGVK